MPRFASALQNSWNAIGCCNHATEVHDTKPLSTVLSKRSQSVARGYCSVGRQCRSRPTHPRVSAAANCVCGVRVLVIPVKPLKTVENPLKPGRGPVFDTAVLALSVLLFQVRQWKGSGKCTIRVNLKQR